MAGFRRGQYAIAKRDSGDSIIDKEPTLTEQPEKSHLLTHYTHALHLLRQHGGEPTHDLAKRLGTSKQAFSLFMSTLVRAGLVERKPRPKTYDHTWDHTAFSYYLTPEGHSLLNNS